MISAENLALWKGKDVFDPSGEKLGKFDELYYDGESDIPSFLVVKGGLVGKHVTLLPVSDARVGPDFVRVTTDKATYKDAPSFSPDDELSGEDEAAVFGYFKLPYTPAGAGARRLAKR